MLRMAVQPKGRLYEETMDLLKAAGIKLVAVKRTLLVPSRNFPVELLFLRDDDIPDSVASGTADIGIVGLNEVMEKRKDVKVVRPLGFSKCRLSLAIPKEAQYGGVEWFQGKKIATSYPTILTDFLKKTLGNGFREFIFFTMSENPAGIFAGFIRIFSQPCGRCDAINGAYPPKHFKYGHIQAVIRRRARRCRAKRRRIAFVLARIFPRAPPL